VTTAVERLDSVTGLVNDTMATKQPTPFHRYHKQGLRSRVRRRAARHLPAHAGDPHLVERGGGSIVNFGSGSGTGGEPGWGAYAGAKEAIRGTSKVAALEWVGTGSG
jgi:NAD(P)-dependent dehydrogenase (short-subunit alcohol dehydrogenase family)